MDRYRLEDVRLKGLWHSGDWRSPGRATIADVARLAFVDEHASALAIRAWLDSRITWRKLWLLASDHAGDHEAQVKKLP